MWMGDMPGNIIKQRTGSSDRQRDITTHVTRHAMRAQVTHVAVICNDAAVQPLLPQVVLGDASTLTVALQRELEINAPPHVHVWRMSSHWVDLAVMQAIVRALAAVVRALSPPRRCVLLLDCCPVHLKPEFLQTARALNVTLLFIPAKFTWLLQPLDAHVFNLYKRTLRRQWARMRLESPDGQINMRQWWLEFTSHIHRSMSSQPWAHTFERTGWINGGRQASNYLQRQLEWDTPPHVPDDLPSVAALQDILPRTRGAVANALHRAAARVRPQTPAAVLDAAVSADRLGDHLPRGEGWLIPRARRLLPLPPLPPPASPPSPSALPPPSPPRTLPPLHLPRAFSPAASQSPAETPTERPRPRSSASSSDAPISHRTRSRSFGPRTSS